MIKVMHVKVGPIFFCAYSLIQTKLRNIAEEFLLIIKGSRRRKLINNLLAY